MEELKIVIKDFSTHIYIRVIHPKAYASNRIVYHFQERSSQQINSFKKIDICPLLLGIIKVFEQEKKESFWKSYELLLIQIALSSVQWMKD